MMRKLRALWIRLLGVFSAGREDAEFAAELENHVALHTEDGIRAGLAPEEARRQALIRLGGAEQTRQAYREGRTLPWLENLLRDLAYSVRRLGKQPVLTAVAVLSIGLGIGANATIFSMVSRFLLRPAPVGDPATLLALHIGEGGMPFSWPIYSDFRAQEKSFSGVAGYYPLLSASLGGNGEPERVWGQAVTANFFDVLELRMMRGRSFFSSEENEPVVVLGAQLWQRRFNSDPAIVGKTVTLSGHLFTVVGVAPAAFHSVDQILDAQFWVPLGNANQLVPNFPSRSDRYNDWLYTVGRLRPGITRTQAGAELKVLAKGLDITTPEAVDGVTVASKDHTSFTFEQAGTLEGGTQRIVTLFLTALAVVVLLVLAIACANVANLLFAQAVGRQREMAVRLALGSTRGRLQRQMLMESLLLGLGGGLLGVLLSLWATRALSTLQLPMQIPLDIHIGMDWRVLLYTFVLSILSGVLLGVAPAWAAARPRLANALKGEDTLARPGRRISLRNILVVAQIAMSVVLLSMIGLFVRSLQNAASADIGIRPQGVLMMSVDPQNHSYTPERTIAFLTQVQQRMAALPGVEAAVWTDRTPLALASGSGGASIHLDGQEKGTYSNLVTVTPGYFQAMGVPLIAGRDFGNETVTGPRTAIVSRAFVDRALGGKNPIGQHVTCRDDSYEIIGVADNVKQTTADNYSYFGFYRSLAQTIHRDSAKGDPLIGGYTLVVHTKGSPQAVMDSARRQIHALDPTMAVFNEETMEEHIHAGFFFPRLAAALFGIFGGIGLILALVGLYGVMSYAVSRRTREIGIRMAMGAQPGTVERLVLRQGLVLTLVAVALGWPAAWMLAKLAASFLYGIQPHDTLTFVLAPLFLIAIALAACWIPARRAASIDPMQALRTE
jgi:predicted permease